MTYVGFFVYIKCILPSILSAQEMVVHMDATELGIGNSPIAESTWQE